jgi:hypothetical protein
MKFTLQRSLAAIIMILGAASTVTAGPFEDGVMAYSRGDYATAMQHFRPLAEQGNAIAQFNLGVMYQDGKGVPKDYAEAIKWYRRAADQGAGGAQFNLGGMYARGEGVQRDDVRAYMWINLSTAQGIGGAERNRDGIAQHMTAEQIAEAQKLAREWKATSQPPR